MSTYQWSWLPATGSSDDEELPERQDSFTAAQPPLHRRRTSLDVPKQPAAAQPAAAQPSPFAADPHPGLRLGEPGVRLVVPEGLEHLTSVPAAVLDPGRAAGLLGTLPQAPPATPLPAWETSTSMAVVPYSPPPQVGSRRGCRVVEGFEGLCARRSVLSGSAGAWGQQPAGTAG